MPTYTFFGRQYTAKDRRTAIAMANRDNAAANRARLMELEAEGVDLSGVPGWASRVAAPVQTVHPTRPVQIVDVRPNAKPDEPETVDTELADLKAAIKAWEESGKTGPRPGPGAFGGSGASAAEVTQALAYNRARYIGQLNEMSGQLMGRGQQPITAFMPEMGKEFKDAPFPVTEGDVRTKRIEGRVTKYSGWDETLGLYGEGEFESADTWISHTDALAMFMMLPKEEIGAWQERLAAAGFFGYKTDGSIPGNAYIPQVADPDTIQAFDQFLKTAAGRGGIQFQSGRGVVTDSGTGQDWNQLLDEMTVSFTAHRQDLEAKAAAEDGGGGGGGGGVRRADPLQVKALVQQVAQLLTGKILSDDEAMAMAEQVNDNAVAALSGNQDYDMQSNIAQMLRMASPEETTAHDLVNMYSEFTGLIGPLQNQAARGGSAEGITYT
ncbi:MAG: hypothetical protein FJ038_03910 [Chloroflexi bacterium]|nr:hypothetical protein [Chloroflexota bacterium]